MGRKVELAENNLIIHFTGLTSAAALKRTLAIPYESIKEIKIEDFKPDWLAFRIGTSIPGLDVYEGRFLHADGWYFLSYEHRDKVITLILDGQEYHKVLFEVEDPEEMKAEILRRCSRSA